MWAGCYSLDLYCDNFKGTRDEVHDWGQGFPHQFTDEHGSRCRAMAREAGWLLKSDGSAICPKCNRKTKAPK